VDRPRVIAGAVVALAFTGLMSPAAAATAPVRFGVIQYNPSGPDYRTARQLDREWVIVVNQSAKVRVLTGWTVRDADHHVYRFGSFRLKPGGSVKLHTGSGRDSGSQLYWGSGNFIWNNTGDTATLENARGVKQNSCTWGDGSGSIVC
jgi:hypothetical protein